MPKKLTSEQKAHIRQVPNEHSKTVLVQYLDELGLNSQGTVDELAQRVRLGDDGVYRPDIFQAKFDPNAVTVAGVESTESLAGAEDDNDAGTATTEDSGEPEDEVDE